MKQTPARTRFKKYFGQANHYVVTALVALYNLESSSVSSAPPDLRTTWNPKDKSASIHRTRLFILQSVLSSAVDAIDMYISLLRRKPNYIRDAALCSELNKAKRSVLLKVIAIANHYTISPHTVALVEVLITWRNNVVHELADNSLSKESSLALTAHAKKIAEVYRGLNPNELPAKAEGGDSLTFKEAASLVNAAHHFVQEVDTIVLEHLDTPNLCYEIVKNALEEGGEKNDFVAKYYSFLPDARRRYVQNWLANKHGISGLAAEALEPAINITRPQKC